MIVEVSEFLSTSNLSHPIIRRFIKGLKHVIDLLAFSECDLFCIIAATVLLAGITLEHIS